MATVSDVSRNTTAEAAQAAQEAVRKYLDESTTLGRSTLTTWAATTQAGLRTAFELQNATVQASRALFDSTIQANRAWMDQAAESMRKSQEVTAKLVAAGFNLVESATQNGRM